MDSIVYELLAKVTSGLILFLRSRRPWNTGLYMLCFTWLSQNETQNPCIHWLSVNLFLKPSLNHCLIDSKTHKILVLRVVLYITNTRRAQADQSREMFQTKQICSKRVRSPPPMVEEQASQRACATQRLQSKGCKCNRHGWWLRQVARPVRTPYNCLSPPTL